jgi:glycosyltransferase involved in cell wall biosynthesis
VEKLALCGSTVASARCSTKTVTVLVPCHNYGHFLTQCVTSVLAQKGVDVSVLVIDDASTDQSACVAMALARHDSRVRLISLPKNVGVIRAVNYGLREVEGKYFVKLDADDLLSPGSLARSVALLETHPNVGFVYGWPRIFTGDAPPRARTRLTLGAAAEWLVVRGRPWWTVWDGAAWLTLRYRRAVNCICQPEAMIRTSILRTVGEYNIGLPHTYDLEMWLRLAAVSDVGRINHFAQGYYRVHPDSQSRTINAGPLVDFRGRRDAFISALSAGGKGRPGSAELEAIVRRKLATQAIDYARRAFDQDRGKTVPVDALIEFALATFQDARTLPEWRDLQRSQRPGGTSRWLVTSIAATILRRTQEEIAYARWIRTGV